MSASLSGLVSKPGAKPSSAARGPAKPATELQPVQGAGTATTLSASERDALRSKLEKLWNPNCETPGASAVVIKVRMRLKLDGTLAQTPEVVGRSGEEGVAAAAAARAISAAGRGAPYTELSPAHYNVWKDVVFTFNAKSACGRR